MVVQTLTVAFAFGVMLINLAADLIYPCSTRASGWVMSTSPRTSGRDRGPAAPMRLVIAALLLLLVAVADGGRG